MTENEEKKPEIELDKDGKPVHKNWVTDIYDKINVKLWQVDLVIVLLGALIIGLALFAK